jgi:hypothetical protein
MELELRYGTPRGKANDIEDEKDGQAIGQEGQEECRGEGKACR